MNLFVFGWNIPSELHSVAIGYLQQMIEIYPQLDCDTIWHISSDKVFAGSMHTNEKACLSRRYVYQSMDQVVFYDGCLIDFTDNFNAMDAAELYKNWDNLPEVLEGQFSVVRITKNEPSIELLTDFLGMGHVYYFKKNDRWLLSNSVHLLRQIYKDNSLDPLGISLFLSLGWVGSDRTLSHNIQVVPGGVRWKWKRPNDSPIQENYYSPRNLSVLPRKKKFTRSESISLSNKLIRMCTKLAGSVGELECPITGGRDSRVLVSLLIRGGVRAQYYTSGSPYSSEVQIGKQIAAVFGLPHKVIERNVEDLSQQWEDLSWKLIKQNDGMVSLWQIADIMQQPSHVESLGIRLWGIGGEIARRFYKYPLIIFGKKDLRILKKLLSGRVLHDYNGVIRKEAMQLSKEYLYKWVEQAIEEGFLPIDIPDIFYTYERVRRWAGDNARKAHPVVDLFSPFCTRPFVESAFAIPALYRYSEPIHYQLVLLEPKLHKISFEKEAWRSQLPGVNLLEMLWVKKVSKFFSERIFFYKKNRKLTQIPAFNQYSLLEDKLLQLREFCLDQNNSPLWNFVERSIFEKIMLPTFDSAERRKCASVLYRIITLFYYSLIKF